MFLFPLLICRCGNSDVLVTNCTPCWGPRVKGCGIRTLGLSTTMPKRFWFLCCVVIGFQLFQWQQFVYGLYTICCHICRCSGICLYLHVFTFSYVFRREQMIWTAALSFQTEWSVERPLGSMCSFSWEPFLVSIPEMDLVASFESHILPPFLDRHVRTSAGDPDALTIDETQRISIYLFPSTEIQVMLRLNRYSGQVILLAPVGWHSYGAFSCYDCALPPLPLVITSYRVQSFVI